MRCTELDNIDSSKSQIHHKLKIETTTTTTTTSKEQKEAHINITYQYYARLFIAIIAICMVMDHFLFF